MAKLIFMYLHFEERNVRNLILSDKKIVIRLFFENGRNGNDVVK